MKQNVNYLKHHKAVSMRMSEDNISAIDVSVYNALFMIWNISGFESELSINRSEVMNISKVGNKNTYTASLKTLHDKGYIHYKPSHNPLIGSVVTLTIFGNSKDGDTMPKSGNSSGKTTGKSSGKSGGTLPITIEPINEGTKTTSFSGGDAPVPDDIKVPPQPDLKSKEKKKSSGKRKKEDVTPHWKEMREVWAEFFSDRHSGHRPTFNGECGTALKSILRRLQQQTAEYPATKDKEWTAEYAATIFTKFLTKAFAIPFYSQNFRLPLLSSHYDTIAPHKNGQSTSKAGRTEIANADLANQLAEHYSGIAGKS